MIHRGKLNRGEISKQADIGKSAFRQNPALAKALEDLEKYLRSIGILPSQVGKSTATKASPSKERDNSAIKVRLLEAENNKLRSEILELKAKLSRYSELEEVINTMGNIL